MKLEPAHMPENKSCAFVDVVKILSEETGLLSSDIRRIISDSEETYKTYTIPKRTGGVRVISQPARQVKLLQRAFVKCVLSKLPLHQSATAYRTGKSVADNADPHKGVGNTILKFDFSNFFPSIRHTDWMSYCSLHNLLNKEDQSLTSKLLFKKEPNVRGLRLAIGAPSSPILSNILMYEFDCLVHDIIVSAHVSYTRYADDLTFSAPRTGYLVNVEKDLRKIIKSLSHPKLEIKESKTVYATTKYRRVVTGVTLTNQGTLSIGKQKKRTLSASVHHAKLGKLNAEEMKRLSGYLAYVNVIEPKFISYLQNKYGKDIILTLKKIGNPRIKS